MNIFYLDKNLTRCARYHCDKHVIKMILESTQILCTVLHENGINAPYRSTHRQHPCMIWAGESLENWLWLRDLTSALNQEYQYRFSREMPHKSYIVSAALPLPPLPNLGITERPQVIPEKYRMVNSVSAYRQFYAVEKCRLLQYTKRAMPGWIA